MWERTAALISWIVSVVELWRGSVLGLGVFEPKMRYLESIERVIWGGGGIIFGQFWDFLIETIF
jgi:hypothetical protein